MIASEQANAGNAIKGRTRDFAASESGAKRQNGDNISVIGETGKRPAEQAMAQVIENSGYQRIAAHEMGVNGRRSGEEHPNHYQRETLIAGKLDDEFQQLRESAAALIRRLGGRITPRELARHIWRLRDISLSSALLTTMSERGMGSWETTQPGLKGGRPSRVFVLGPSIGETGDVKKVI